MALYLTDVRSVNLKSHTDIHITLPAKGVVRFRGRNNDGKSVIPDALLEVIGCTLHNKRKRVPLINYNVDEGYLTLRRSDGAILHVTINREAAKTFYRLQLPGGDVITRYLADKGLRELVRLFGFHWDEKREMSLNLYNTYHPLLFVTTPESFNHDILTSVITDQTAEDAKIALEGIKKQFEEGLKSINQRISEREAVIANMKFYDEQVLNDKASDLRYLALQINNLATHNLPDLREVPNIEEIERLETSKLWNDLRAFNPVEIPFYSEISNLTNLPKITDIREKLEYHVQLQDAYDNGKCYTCGRRYKRGRKSCDHNTRSSLA